MLRKSLETERRASSAIAPAISTPVGPPPMTTKVSSALRRSGSRLSFGPLEREQYLAADRDRVLDALESRRMRRPFVPAEIAVAGAGREDQPVVSRQRPLASCDCCSASASTPVTSSSTHADVWCARQDRPDRRGDVAPATGPPSRPGRAEAETGGGCAGRRSSRRQAGRRAAWPRQAAETGADDDDARAIDRCRMHVGLSAPSSRRRPAARCR